MMQGFYFIVITKKLDYYNNSTRSTDRKGGGSYQKGDNTNTGMQKSKMTYILTSRSTHRT